MSNELGIHEQRDLSIAREPNEVLAEAQRAAAALKEVIAKKDKPVIFNGEQYLEFEDWQTVGKFYGITVKVVETRPVQFGEVMGFEARAVAINNITGREVSAAEAMCLNDEGNWKIKPLFQLRSMAQTRACAKAFRNVLAWVVVLAGYKPTPAEEMTDGGKQNKQATTEPSNTPVIVKSVASKEGKKTVDGKVKTWTLHTITDEHGAAYTTFDDKIAEYARKAQNTGLSVVIVSEKDKFGYKLVEIKSAPPKATETAVQPERQPGEEG